MITNSKTTDGAMWLQEWRQWVLGVSLLVGLVVLVCSDSKAQTTETIISETTTVENQGAGLELHTTTTVTEQTIVGNQETTQNYLTNPGFQTGNIDGWAVQQGETQVCETCGPFGGRALKTQGEDGPGGTISQTVDLFSKMTEAEIQQGFNLKYGSHVHSDESNAVVPVCDSNPSNGPDCRDTFSITLDVKDSSGLLLHKFEHEFKEITFTGWNTTDFFFEQTIPSNDYTSALATLQLFGIDSGFPDRFFGPYFDNAVIQAIHTDIVIQQITTITEELIQTAIATLEDTSSVATNTLNEPTVEPIETVDAEVVEVFEVSVSDNFSNTMESFEVTIDTNMEMTIEPIVIEAPVEMVEATVAEVTTEVETQVAEVTEMEINNDISNDMEPTRGASAESTTEPEPSQDGPAAEESESGEDTQTNQDPANEESDSESEPKTAKVEEKEEKTESEPKTKEEVKREIAQKVVQNIVSRLGQSTQDQATQVALMNLISADITANQPVLQDQTQWYQSTTVYNNQSIATNNKAQYYMFGGSDAAMNRLVDTQYK
jgi:hypothetical protein